MPGKSFRGLSLARSAVVLAAGALLATLFAVPASAADPVGQITGLGGKCVDVAGASNANGTPVQLYDCNGSNAQRWTVASDGTLRALGKCLDIVERGTADGALVQLWDCGGGANQQWVVNSARDIVNPQANKCLDVKDRSTANGARLQIWTCTGQTNQKWTAAGTSGGGNPSPSGFVVSESQF
uniref:ricin-type beta-trefoil lectin domain protein n=1 Tax=Streptomyces lushanensis TaxID=1434255 RepID=UPI000A3FE426